MPKKNLKMVKFTSDPQYAKLVDFWGFEYEAFGTFEAMRRNGLLTWFKLF